MPEFNNLLEGEAYYKEEAQAKAEGREPDHSPKPDPEPVHENSIFNPDPALAYPIPTDPETIAESGSPYVESTAKVAPTYDPAELTPIPQYNSDGTNAELEDPEDSEPPVAEPVSEDNLTTADVASSDTPKE